jgi:hypothetical protein
VGDGRQDATGQPPTERVSVPQAADHLGTTVDAIRKRVQRGTIPYEKDGDGRVWILLDTGRPRHDTDQDTTRQRQDASDELANELRDRVRYLERQVEEEREARRRADMLLAQLVQRIPELEAPSQEPPQAPREATEQPGRGEAQPAVEGTQESAEATDEQQGRGPLPEAPSTQTPSERPWWRRMFGG